MNEKNNEKDFDKRLSSLEERVEYLLLPALCSCLDEAVFGGRGAYGHDPLKLWILAALRGDLPDEGRKFLTDFLEKIKLANYKPLKK
jgi:hypothetical protein